VSIDSKGHRYCDECGRGIVKAHRLHKGAEYCSSCYPRVFVALPCSRCARPTRTHRHATTEPICRQCDRETRRCLRCERPVRQKAARLVDGRPVCGSCAPYFLQPEPCAWCGVDSIHLSRAPRLGIVEKICNACRNKLTHRSCATCRRYRSVAGLLPDGKPHCDACTPGAQQAHACPGCGSLLAGRGQGRCTACLNRERIERDTVLQVLALERDWSRAAYGEFGQWLLAEQPDKPNLAKVFASHFPFFARVDVSVSDPQALRGNGLLDMFNVAELRKHVLPVRFLGSHVGVALDESAKIEQIERSRIAEKLLASRHMPYAAVLQRYVGWLDEQGVPTRTIRLYLTAANQLCKVEGIGESGACEEAQLQHFLRSHPGSRASLFRWLTFGRSVLGWRLTMPRPRSGKHRLPRTVLDLSVLMKKIEQVGLERAPLKFLHRVIAKTFGFPVAHLSAHQWRVIEKGEEIYLSNERESIRVPEPMRHLVKVWADRVDATST
jgi:hypothetical protein